MPIIWFLLAFLLITLGNEAPLFAQQFEEPDYKLGPQDNLQIRVYDLRPQTGEAFEWPSYNSEYTIGSSGKISLPIVGNISASGLSTLQLEATVSEKLREKVGLAQKPSVTVQIVKYRPVYIYGDVQKPGEYDYRPGLNVLQSISIAGGMSRLELSDFFAQEKDAISTRGEMRLLRFQNTALQIRRSRLEAEIKGLTKPELSTGDFNLEDGNVETKNLIEQERNLFFARQQTQSSKISNLAAAQKSLSEEIASLKQKEASIANLAELSRRDLNQIKDLFSKGLVSSPRQLAAEQASATYNSNMIDTQIARVRAEQELSKNIRDIIDIKEKEKADNIEELTDIQKKITENTTKIRSLTQTLSNIFSKLGRTAGNDNLDDAATIKIEIFSADSKNIMSLSGNETKKVSPGDVVRVEAVRNGEGKR